MTSSAVQIHGNFNQQDQINEGAAGGDNGQALLAS